VDFFEDAGAADFPAAMAARISACFWSVVFFAQVEGGTAAGEEGFFASSVFFCGVLCGFAKARGESNAAARMWTSKGGVRNGGCIMA
jgi:hypothetical protein